MSDTSHSATADALDRAAQIAAFFAAVAGDDEPAAEQARRDENCLRRWSALLRTL